MIVLATVARAIVRALLGADLDGGCLHCQGIAIEAVIAQLPELDWSFLPDEIEAKGYKRSAGEDMLREWRRRGPEAWAQQQAGVEVLIPFHRFAQINPEEVQVIQGNRVVEIISPEEAERRDSTFKHTPAHLWSEGSM